MDDRPEGIDRIEEIDPRRKPPGDRPGEVKEAGVLNQILCGSNETLTQQSNDDTDSD